MRPVHLAAEGSHLAAFGVGGRAGLRRQSQHPGDRAQRPRQGQGRGVGNALLGCFLEQVDQQGLPTFLETDVDRNVALYEQFGFTVTARQDILGVNTRFMCSDPRTATPGGYHH